MLKPVKLTTWLWKSGDAIGDPFMACSVVTKTFEEQEALQNITRIVRNRVCHQADDGPFPLPVRLWRADGSLVGEFTIKIDCTKNAPIDLESATVMSPEDYS